MRAALILIILSFFVSCSNSKTQPTATTSNAANLDSARSIDNYFSDCKHLKAEARRMDSILLKEMDLDKTKANNAIKAFTDFAYYCQGDTLSPIFLIKTAQVARAIDNIPQAKLVLDRCVEDYPNFSNRPAALFLLAQLYDENNFMNNETEAQRLYQKIIDEYPKSDWALSAKGAIHFIGKSDEEITKELLKRKK